MSDKIGLILRGIWEKPSSSGCVLAVLPGCGGIDSCLIEIAQQHLRTVPGAIDIRPVNDNLQAMQAQYMHQFFRKEPNGNLSDVLVELPKSQIQVRDAKDVAGQFPFFTSGTAVLRWHEPLANGRVLLLNTGGNADVKFYVGEIAYSTDTWAVTAPDGLADYVYMLLNSISPELDQKYFLGTGLRHLQKPLLKKRPIYVPSESELEKFNSVAVPAMTLVSENLRQNRRLSQLRDWLLPMLMNGQATVASSDKLSFVIGSPSTAGLLKSRAAVETSSPGVPEDNMERQIIKEVLQGMLSALNNAQLKQLGSTLRRVMAGYTVQAGQQGQSDDEDLLTAFIAAKRLEGCSEKTLIYYERTITAMLNNMSISATRIRTEDLRAYLTTYQRERGTSQITIDNIRRILSSFFVWLEDEDHILKSPVRRIHKVKSAIRVKETYTDEELETMRDRCPTLRDLAMIDLLASTGMRVGELVKLDRNDIDFDERECVVQGKGNKERVAYFDARTKLHLSQYLEQRNDHDPALFVGLNSPHHRLSIGGIEVRLRQLGSALKLSRVHPHKFRRTLATKAIDKGMPVEQVQHLLGHQRIDTTLQYAMVRQANVKGRSQALHRVERRMSGEIKDTRRDWEGCHRQDSRYISAGLLRWKHPFYHTRRTP